MKAKVGTVIAMVVAGLTAAGCGSSKSAHTTATTRTTTAATHTAASANAATATAPTVTSGPVHASLHGSSHKPAASKKWTYTVHATDASGKPLSGTVDTEFAFAGTVVGHESPPIHRLRNGGLVDKVTFPPSSVGHPLTLVTVVHTNAGSVALGWPVTPVK